MAGSGFLSKLKKELHSEPEGRKVDPVIKAADHTGTDEIGVYPSKINVPVLEGRRYLWTTRVFAIGFYLSVILNILLVLTVFTLAPLKRVEPFLVTFSEQAEQVVRIQPFVKNASGFDLFVEQMTGEYVRMREEIILDEEEMRRRWTEYLRHRTDPEDYNSFLRRVNEPYQKLRKQGISRIVRINRIRRLSANHIEVYFSTRDYDRRGNELLMNDWIARLRVGFSTQTVSLEEQYINPIGFTVYNYSVTRNE